MEKKPFMIKCLRCNWSRMSMGIKADLNDLTEIKSNCSTCGKWRKFNCPKCSGQAVMKRIRGNT